MSTPGKLQARGGRIDSGAEIVPGIRYGNRFLFGQETELRRIHSNVYISDENEVSVVFYICNEEKTIFGSDLASNAVMKRMASATPPKYFKLRVGQFTAKLGDTIETHIECEGSSELIFKQTEPFMFKIDEDIDNHPFVEHQGVISGNLKEAQLVYLFCTVHKVSGKDRKLIDKSYFTCGWVPKSFESPTLPAIGEANEPSTQQSIAHSSSQLPTALQVTGHPTSPEVQYNAFQGTASNPDPMSQQSGNPSLQPTSVSQLVTVASSPLTTIAGSQPSGFVSQLVTVASSPLTTIAGSQPSGFVSQLVTVASSPLTTITGSQPSGFVSQTTTVRPTSSREAQASAIGLFPPSHPTLRKSTSLPSLLTNGRASQRVTGLTNDPIIPESNVISHQVASSTQQTTIVSNPQPNNPVPPLAIDPNSQQSTSPESGVQQTGGFAAGREGEPSVDENMSTASITVNTDGMHANEEIDRPIVTRFGDPSVGTMTLEGETTSTEDSATQTSTSMEMAGTQIGELVTAFGNLDVGTRSLENKTTSTEDSATQTSISVKMAETQTDEVVTTFGNLNNGTSISKSIHKVIGSEDERLNVGGCSAAFPSDSFSESTPVNVTAELNTSRSKKFILFTPSLHIDANGLRRKVRVRLPSWYVNKRQQKAEARILHLRKDADDWEDTGMLLPVTNRPFFDFEWQDFSAVAVGVDESSPTLQVISRRIAGNIYISDANEVCIVFHINDKETPTSESMASEVVKERMASAKPPKHWKIRLRQFKAKYNDDIEAHIECDVPSDLTFKPKEPLIFQVDENFDEEPFVEHNGVVSGALEEEQLIEMRCTVNKISENNKKRIGSPSFFTCNWMPRKLGKKQKQSEKVSDRAVPSGVNVNVNVNADQSQRTETENIDNSGHIVTADKYVGPKAQVTLSGSNNSATVAKLGEKQKQSEKVSGRAVPSGVNVNVNADQSQHTETENIDNSGHIVTANKYVGPKAQVTLSETNTSATVAIGKSSTEMERSEESDQDSQSGGEISFESKNTSTEDLLPSDTAGSEGMLIDAKSGVVTRFHNRPSGLAISKSLRRVIGSESEQLHVGDCLVAFFSESFTKSTPVTVMAEIDRSKWPKNFTGYTPTLYVDAEGLKKKVRVKLPSWRVTSHSEKAEARILHIPKGRTEWEDTKVTLPVTNEPYFEFEWEDFSPIVIGDWWGDWFGSKTPIDYRIAGNVYASDESEISVAYYLNGGAGPDSMISELVSKRMTSAKPPKHFKIRLNGFILETDEGIETRISCEKPIGLEFKPSDPFTFTADKIFSEDFFSEHHGVVLGELTERQRMYLECSICKKTGEKIGNTAWITCKWTPQIKLVEKPKQPEVLPSPAVTPGVNLIVAVNADQSQREKIDNSGHNVTTNKYVAPKGHLQSSESNTSATAKVKNSGSSTNQK